MEEEVEEKLPILPEELWHYIWSLYLIIPLRKQWKVLVNELWTKNKHLLNVPLKGFTMDDVHSGVVRVSSIESLQWYGNRIAMIRYGDEMHFVYRGDNEYEM